jgi:Na+/proline symporter
MGLMARRVSEAAAMAGMTAGVAVNLWIRFAAPGVAWTWYVLIGSSVTIAAGLAASLVLKGETD